MWEGLVALVAAVFGAGTAWGMMRGRVRELRKDLNGLGKKLMDHVADEKRERERVRLILLDQVGDEKRRELIRNFWNG